MSIDWTKLSEGVDRVDKKKAAEVLTGIGNFGHRDVQGEDRVKTEAEWRCAPQVPGLLLAGTR